MVFIEDVIFRKLFLGFIQIHILHHAKKEPFFGVWMMEELNEHGYTMSPGTLYPLLHSMEKAGLLMVECRNHGGKMRKYYSITETGINVLKEAKKRARELMEEIEE